MTSRRAKSQSRQVADDVVEITQVLAANAFKVRDRLEFDWALRVAETAGSAGTAAAAPMAPEDDEGDFDDVETETFDGDDSGEAVADFDLLGVGHFPPLRGGP